MSGCCASQQIHFFDLKILARWLSKVVSRTKRPGIFAIAKPTRTIKPRPYPIHIRRAKTSGANVCWVLFGGNIVPCGTQFLAALNDLSYSVRYECLQLQVGLVTQ